MKIEYLYILLCSVVFALASVIGSCWWYAKRQHTSYRTALLVLWQDGVVAGFKGGVLSVKTAASTAWSYAKRLALMVWEYLKPTPAKHVFAPELYYCVYEAIRDYIYIPFQPVITVVYDPIPSYLYVSLYTKSAITEEIAAELLWHISAVFQDYQNHFGLSLDATAVPYVQDNRFDLRLYYCEHQSEYSAYRATCRRAMLMKADPLFRPLPESAVPQTAELVLGYKYDNWRSSEQIVPFVWDTATAPHLLVSGPTGGGKTVFVKALLERLLKSGASVTVCDFKGYGDLRGFVKDYAAGKGCDAALAAFCADFEQARSKPTNGRKHILLFDEFGSFSASKEKKDYGALMRMLSNLIYMGRSYGYHIILVGQRFDADVLRTSLRDQFGVKVYLGPSISQQAATMLFPNCDIDKSTRLAPFCGYVSTPKTDCAVLIMPEIDVPALDKRLKALGRENHH